MNHDEIADRVRKLLRLAQSANQHEATLALEHAVRLAAKHKVDLASLELDPEYEKVIHDHFRIGARLTYITKLVLPIVRDFFHVELVVSRPNVVFAGTATDVAIASYVLGFLTQICARYLSEFEREKKRRPSLSRRQNFIAGFIYGIRAQLSKAAELLELADSQSALAIREQRERREDYMAQLFPKTAAVEVRKPRWSHSAVMAGFVRGRETSIRTPLTASQTQLRLLQ